MDDVQTYTWSQFTAAVNSLLPIDASRLGSVPSLMALWTRLAVIELESLIPAYRQNHETLYHPGDFVLEGYASRASLPPQARVKDTFLVEYDSCAGNGLGPNLVVAGASYGADGSFVVSVGTGGSYAYSKGLNDINLVNGSQTLTANGTFLAQGVIVTLNGSPNQQVNAVVQVNNLGSSIPQLNSISNVTTSIAKCTRFPLIDFAWSKRMDLVNGCAPVNDHRGFICFDPQGETFYTYPGIKDCQNVSVFWDGMKIQFQPDEMTPFSEQMTLVVADAVESRLRQTVDKDIPLSQECQNRYINGRSLLAIEAKDRMRTNA
jgi:hypothetical protein